MAVCFQYQTIWVPYTNAATPRYATQVLVPNATDPSNCTGLVALSSTEYTDFLSNIANFGWDLEAFELAIGGALLMFVIGLGIGLIINTIRKARTL